jgi:leucyl aminopeptidase
MSPANLSDRVVKFAHLDSEIVDPVRAGLGALVAVGGSSPIPPRLIVLRHRPPGASGYGVRRLVELATQLSVRLSQ